VHLVTPLWRLQCFHITVSVVATLACLKADPEELSREGFNSCFLSLRSFLGGHNVKDLAFDGEQGPDTFKAVNLSPGDSMIQGSIGDSAGSEWRKS
jgi:hypothetical protein